MSHADWTYLKLLLAGRWEFWRVMRSRGRRSQMLWVFFIIYVTAVAIESTVQVHPSTSPAAALAATRLVLSCPAIVHQGPKGHVSDVPPCARTVDSPAAPWLSVGGPVAGALTTDLTATTSTAAGNVVSVPLATTVQVRALILISGAVLVRPLRHPGPRSGDGRLSA